MMTPETIREAALAPQPWSRLDEIVRAEMAAGRKVKDIAAEYWEIAQTLHDSNDLPEDADDALMDTFDALRGLCHPKHRYTDPPSTSLPSKEEIAGLPHWAQVAFAARCARRVERLFHTHWPTAPGEYRQDVANAVAFAEMSAQAGEYAGGSRAWAHEAAESAPNALSSNAAWVASAAHVLAATDADNLVELAFLIRVTADVEVELKRPIRQDFDKLAGLAATRKWTDDTPVLPDVFGPLWPEGSPKGWPADPELPKHADLPVELAVKEGLSDTAVEDEVVNLFNAINRYYIARGGQPLSLEDFQPFVPAMQLAEV